MSYVSLARKYRPRRFVDMVGQESTTLALTNAIRLRREPHSVIFTGVRGVGKTTSARIYAKALNCENGPTAEPCDECASCVAIASGNHEDVLEIDGASNTGVDDVRALQETLSYVPQRSTYKIYIIDEVHMLSISAFNALLKTLEEPPQHVVFIFATTELHKVPETIQSRCQTFHLQKISRPVIADRVRSILTAEGIPFDEGALAIVAREGRGSMRDALTMLDQAIAVGGGQVSLEALKNMVGSSSQALPVLELLDGLLRKDASQILEVIARWDQEGLAMSTLVEETAKACRNAFILRDLKGQAIDLQLLELEDREQQMLLELGEKAAPMDLNRLFRQLAKCLDDLRHADLDRFILENYCLEWCFDPGLPDLQTLMNIMASGQPMPQIAAARPAPQAAPAEGPAINLRERWKTSAPSASAPAARPAAAPTSAPQPAPMAKPAAPSVGKGLGPQASLDKPLASTPMSQTGVKSPQVGVSPSQAGFDKPGPPVSGPSTISQASAQPMAISQPPLPPTSAAISQSSAQPLGSAMSQSSAQPAISQSSAQPMPQTGAMPSSLVQKLAMAQAAQAAQVAAAAAQPTLNPLRAAKEAQLSAMGAPHTAKSNSPGEPESAKTVAHTPAAEAAKPEENTRPASSNPEITALLEKAKPAAEHTPPSQMESASPPAAEPAPAGPAPKSLRSLLDSAAQNSASAAKAQPAARAEAKPAALIKTGGTTRMNGPAMPPEPPPFDLSDDDVPPWVLQEEAARQGAVAAPMDEPAPPEPPKNESFLKQMARRDANTPAPPPAPPKVEVAPAPVAEAPWEPFWPENWRAFVDEWKKQKPLQGRVLEEAYLLEYTPQRIRLAVEPTSMAGGKLLQQDVRKRLMEQFTQLFGFKGILEAVPKADAHPGKSAAGQAPDLGETLLDVKNREREVAREHLRARLEEHPMTREVISRFGGTIEQIELQ
ncbi:MAG TPA: DNA polymerase III subunit gamma/tau [Oligoflexus sp.]|uniref:DNA polymerase III subunit gamma/tau n=1 Tax=Oligoflexus sp. TaxID=1971216 RepID=UPI002D7E27FE|nr:DNA polymerase III subunit gamma/tau [Oligoflexus sp.]HET9236272.1 DNA polymerase III subunit gamma/tau [Oligoflexus sp.]